MSSDGKSPESHSVYVLSRSEYQRGYINRTREARERAGYEITEMAKLLDLKIDTYSKYEIRTPLPRHLVPKFCLICRTTANWLFGVEEVSGRRPLRKGVRRGRSSPGGKKRHMA